MTIEAILLAISRGETVCYRTSRYEIIKAKVSGRLYIKDLYDVLAPMLLSEGRAKFCSVKVSGV